MRIERDAQHDVLYIELREGEAERTVDLDDGVHMDLDDEGRVLGVEFLSLGAFERYLERHNGQVEIPDRVKVQGVPPHRSYPPTEHDDRSSSLREAIASLAPAQQEILRLRYYEGLGLEEIAEHLNISINTTRTRNRIALRDLGTKLRENEPTVEDERSLEAALREL